jgi:hypothetical protein
MFEQINFQPLAFGKNYTDAFVKAQGLALAGFERITELNLKTFEDRVKASVDFWSEAAEVRDVEARRPSSRRVRSSSRKAPRSFMPTTKKSSASR